MEISPELKLAVKIVRSYLSPDPRHIPDTISDDLLGDYLEDLDEGTIRCFIQEYIEDTDSEYFADVEDWLPEDE